MNEQIKLLWEESQQWNGSDDGRGGLKILESVEKFAELIVRECICQCDDENSQKYIMSHFGFTEKDWS
jgi:hypothetical protein